jgi:hypothetical protein
MFALHQRDKRVPDMDRLSVESQLEGLQPLAELALDLGNCWNHSTDPVWSRIEPELWSITHNPWVILQTASRTKLKALQEDHNFRDQVNELAEKQRQILQSPAWFHRAWHLVAASRWLRRASVTCLPLTLRSRPASIASLPKGLDSVRA